VTLLAIDYPPLDYVIIVVAVLVGLIGKIVEYTKRMREKSIEAEKEADAQFGMEWGEAPEPPARIEPVRRPREQPPVVVVPPPPKPPVVVAASPKPRPHEIVRILRAPRGMRNAIVLAEVLGRPKALRRGR
jgi:hypothetical protein